MLGYVNKNNISLDNICELVDIEYSVDEIGNEKIVKEETISIFCAIGNIGLNEFAKLSEIGYKNTMLLYINECDYIETKFVDFNGERYKIYRMYVRNDELIELYLEKLNK